MGDVVRYTSRALAMRKRGPDKRPRAPRRRGPDKHPRRVSAWSRSDASREIGRQALRAVNASRASLPKCGARAKSTGEPCKLLPAKGRTRCKFHGGATPKGAGPLGWHTPACPGGVPTGKPRSDAYKQRRRREAVDRVETMTPEQRTRYEAWQASHTPGSPTKRQRRRHDRDAARWLADLMAKSRPSDGEDARVRKARPTTVKRTPRDGVDDAFRRAAPELSPLQIALRDGIGVFG
ncbi:hypothetical protein AFCDBAGC_4691 [Methylobacterium cerastii]|uniref:Uncharacterized protein n=2 Tax=Methylobacterium cerastii TaxID=932741 RepID=A0ABQ4QQB3_9HYPH|nr:hypothetical protein AFCDBAGC_4691 [Methylobacterium cerastii]